MFHSHAGARNWIGVSEKPSLCGQAPVAQCDEDDVGNFKIDIMEQN